MNLETEYKHKIRQIQALSPEEGPIIHEASRIIRTGGLVIFPTSALYGMAVDALNQKALEKVFRIKGRRKDKPLLILVESIESVEDYVEEIPQTARNLMQHFWPGHLTLVFRAKRHLPEILTAGTGKIGIRVPRHPVALALVRQTDGPVTGTSANLSEQVSASKIEDLPETILQEADLVLDSGALQGGTGSTVLDVSGIPPRLIRGGNLSSLEIFRFI